MSSLPYVQIEYLEAIDSKRNLLSAQADILNTLKTIQNYKKVRKQELEKKNKLKNSIVNLKKKMKKLLLELPQTKEVPELDLPETVIETTRTNTLDSELKEIQRKIAELGKE